MANDPEHSETIETDVDVTMLEVLAEPDKKSSDAATGSTVEEADEEHGKMEGVTEISLARRKMKDVPLVRRKMKDVPLVRRKMKEVIEEPADRMKDTATSSTMKQEKLENIEVVIEIPPLFTELKGFRQRNVAEIQSYCENQRKSRNVGRGHGRSGFYKVPVDMRVRQGYEGLYDPTYVKFSKLKDLLEKDDPDARTRSLLSHYYYHFFVLQQIHDRKKLEGYLLMIYENREEIARCYGVKEADLDFPQLLGLLLSSCFVFYLFYRPFYSADERKCECFRRWVNDLWVDLLVLENQIPFFVLERISFKDNSGQSHRSLQSCSYEYFREFAPLNRTEKNLKPVHLLDFVHWSLLPDKQSDHRSFFSKLSIFRSFFSNLSIFSCTLRAFLGEYNIVRSREPPVKRVIPTATRLQQTGVQFKPVEEKGFVVEFKKGVLRLPRLHIGKNTKKLFVNLIAREQCHLPAVKYIINFAVLMDHLINTSRDVEILIQSNVLENSLATEEDVATMFNILGKDLIYTKNEFDNREYDFLMELSTELNKYCESRFNMWRAKLMSEYFSNPWTILSLIAALLIILLTLVQTFFSAYSYFRPPK